jgi:hypothetical protein
MLLELRSPRTLDGPMAGVVRAHGELVHHDRGVGLEQLHRQQPDHAEFGGQVDGELLRGQRPVLRQVRCRRDHLDADPVPLHRLDHRIGRHLPERGPSYECRQLPPQRHPLLDDQFGARREQLLRNFGRVHHPHATPVIAAAGRLHHRQPHTEQI